MTMPLMLPKVYPITDRTITGLSHAEQARRLIAGGATLIQLREKSRDVAEWFSDAVETAEICRSNAVALIINDRVDVALAIDAAGVHLGQSDLPPGEARGLLGEGKIIGYSTHTLEQVREAITQPVDHIGFGPIFPTSSKNDADPVVGLESLREAVIVAGDLPVVAIGGIDAANLVQTFAAGASSVAIISAILKQPNDIAAVYSSLNSIYA